MTPVGTNFWSARCLSRRHTPEEQCHTLYRRWKLLEKQTVKFEWYAHLITLQQTVDTARELGKKAGRYWIQLNTRFASHLECWHEPRKKARVLTSHGDLQRMAPSIVILGVVCVKSRSKTRRATRTNPSRLRAAGLATNHLQPPMFELAVRVRPYSF